ncbi:MAG: molecular chaperone DnaJ [Porticoccaceae bacterium]|nr:molecular chaperone DnaJ [Porticoccaceae bacterium]
MVRIIVLLVLAFVLWYLWRETKKLNTLSAEKRRAVIWRSVFIGVFVVTLLLVITGRAHWLSAAIAGLLPAMKGLLTTALRAAPLLKFWGKASSAAFGTEGIGPTLRTQHLEIKINLTNGAMDGTVRKGTYAQSRLSTLSREQLSQLLSTYQNSDRESGLLLNAYMARRFTGFEEAKTTSPPLSGNSDEEAWQILGLQPGASREDISKAHKSLMQKLHPDRGGNDYLAAKVNAAKDQLLKGL